MRAREGSSRGRGPQRNGGRGPDGLPAALRLGLCAALAGSCAQAVTQEPPPPDLTGAAALDGPCGAPRTVLRAVPAATFLGNKMVQGLCVAEVYYCSESGQVSDQTGPVGFTSAVSSPGGCDLNECKGRSCQQNLCKDCRGDCVLNCPR